VFKGWGFKKCNSSTIIVLKLTCYKFLTMLRFMRVFQRATLRQRRKVCGVNLRAFCANYFTISGATHFSSATLSRTTAEVLFRCLVFAKKFNVQNVNVHLLFFLAFCNRVCLRQWKLCARPNVLWFFSYCMSYFATGFNLVYERAFLLVP